MSCKIKSYKKLMLFAIFLSVFGCKGQNRESGKNKSGICLTEEQYQEFIENNCDHISKSKREIELFLEKKIKKIKEAIDRADIEEIDLRLFDVGYTKNQDNKTLYDLIFGKYLNAKYQYYLWEILNNPEEKSIVDDYPELIFKMDDI